MERITLFTRPEECTGCAACAAGCPKGAISMQPDAVGAVYPQIDFALCVRCGKCLQICPEGKTEGVLPRSVYAGVSREPQLLSASGGIFAVLAHAWQAAGGLVAGAVMDQGTVHHILSDRPEQLVRMQGSKYTHSGTQECFALVQQALKQGRNVLFSGTPCQVAAVKRLTGDPDALTTVDIICHGVPSNGMLRDYFKLLGKRFGGPVTAFSFRDKSASKPFTVRFTVRGKTYRLRPRYLSYYQYFLEGATYRENCYTCAYAGPKRVADITIGDFWGIEKHYGSELPDRKDWSCILVNTDKGSRLMSQCGRDLLLYPSTLEAVAEQNGQLNAPSKAPSHRDAVMKAYTSGGYRAVEAMYIRSQGGKLRFFGRMCKELMKEH